MNHTTIKGIDIPIDLVIAVDVLSIHYDKEIWGPMDPKLFYPERFSKKYKRHPASYFAFGIGPRNCVGIKFAYMEMKLVLAKILRFFEVVPSGKLFDQLNFIEGQAVKIPKEHVIVNLRKRH